MPKVTAKTGALSVIGAGIGGLAAAIAARRRGFEVVVYESRDALPSNGGVLLLWANGVKALRALDPDLERTAVRTGTIVRHTEFRTWRGARLWTLPMPQLRRQYGADAVLISRSALVDLLARKATDLGATIRWGAACHGYSLVGRRVRPRLAGHASAPVSDGLIACDGIRSKLRAHLSGKRQPRSAYHMAWIGISDVSADAWPYDVGHTVTFLGGGPRFCASTMRSPASRRIIYWYATEAESRCDESRACVSRRRLLEIFRRRSAEVAGVMSATIDGYPEAFRIHDLDPVWHWAGGPVALLGDAAHASTPDLGQGACQALESAAVLGDELERSPDVSRAFARYARRRMSRTARVTAMSRGTALMSMMHAPGFDAVRDFAIRLFLPTITLAEFDRLFRGDLRTMR
jgi:2-polyprenyl-6-methoxyphenol hydroxylase-like FAD-dependent oxidoreductase